MKRISVPKILSAIAICFGGLSGVSTANAVDCPIKLGGLAPLSAPGSVTGGEAMREAMLLAERDIGQFTPLFGAPFPGRAMRVAPATTRFRTAPAAGAAASAQRHELAANTAARTAAVAVV